MTQETRPPTETPRPQEKALEMFGVHTHTQKHLAWYREIGLSNRSFQMVAQALQKPLEELIESMTPEELTHFNKLVDIQKEISERKDITQDAARELMLKIGYSPRDFSVFLMKALP